MACEAMRYWTISRLIGAFFDLGIAYFLLCCSTAAYFISKFLGFFGFSLPCPCDVVRSNIPDVCLEKLLVNSPKNKISAVQLSVTSNFPFDSVWNRNGDSHLSLKDKQLKDVIELEGGGSCSSISVAKGSENVTGVEMFLKNEGFRFGVKGKGVTRRRRSNLRRQERGVVDRTTLTSDSSYDDFWCSAPVVPLSKCGDSNLGNEITTEDSHDDVENVIELDHKSSESISVTKANEDVDKDMVTFSPNDEHLRDEIRTLKQALEEERAARTALFFDLEKERTAAASAADEAMAMILRLQDEKAAIKLEARQYERVLEEKFTYDADEMDVLKEIIVRREKEKHSLEKEVESYRKMLRENEESEGEDDDLSPRLVQVYDSE